MNLLISRLMFEFSWFDIIDIVLVAVLLFWLYRVIRGTVAMRIFLGIGAVYLFWKLVELLQLKLLSEILGQVMAVGMIALIVVFQQEIRRFLLMLGSQRILGRSTRIRQWLAKHGVQDDIYRTNTRCIVSACKNLAEVKMGALIVIKKSSQLDLYCSGGEKIDSRLNSRLLENIFFKNSPLHDGAVIVNKHRIEMAGVVLPVSERGDLPGHIGTRHRAALGITENSDAVAVVVSEETGDIAYCKNGNLRKNMNALELARILERDFKS